MKTQIAVLIAAVALSTAAQAQDKQALTRAEVKAQVVAAQKAGTLQSGEEYPGNQPFVSTRTRAEVIQETRLTLARGDIAFGEQYPLTPASQPALTRAQVKAELAQALRSGQSVDGLFVQN